MPSQVVKHKKGNLASEGYLDKMVAQIRADGAAGQYHSGYSVGVFDANEQLVRLLDVNLSLDLAEAVSSHYSEAHPVEGTVRVLPPGYRAGA